MFHLKTVLLLLMITCNYQYNCEELEGFKENVDGFMNAFEDTYPTETISKSSEDLSEKNEVPAEASSIGESSKANEEPVDEDISVTEKVFALGNDVKHEITDEVRTLAEKMLSSISSMLQLVNVTDAVSTVTDKVQRSILLVVSTQNCGEGEACEISCRLELISSNGSDKLTWHNCLDSPNANEVLRAKRGAIGGFKQVDDEEAKELAEIAVQTLDSIDADDTKRVVTQVIRAQKQLVNGIMYHLTLEVASSDCKEDSEKCDGKLSDLNICKILMQRHFSGEAPHNAQVIKSECTPISKAKLIEEQKGLIGGLSEADPNSPKIQEMAQFAVHQLDAQSKSINKQKLILVKKAQTQVVAGVNYYMTLQLVETNCRKGSPDSSDCNAAPGKDLQECDVVVYDRPWDKHREVTSIKCSPAPSSKVQKRSLVGGLSDVDPKDPTVQEMAQYAIQQLNVQSNNIYKSKVVLVKKAQTQIVAGVNYYLTLEMVETNCSKGSSSKDVCSAAPGKPLQECDVVVYDRPWDKHREVTSIKCSPAPSSKVQKRSLVGGLSDVDPKDPTVQEMAQYAIQQLNVQSNNIYKSKVVLVKKAQTQIVAGVNYYLTLEMVETNCSKGSSSKDVCSAAPGKPLQECDVVVYDRPWDKHREVTSIKCSPAPSSKVQKRSLLGGLSDADPKDPTVQEMAQYAIRQLNIQSNNIYKSKLVLVKKAQTQIVAGVNYYLTLEMVETNCSKGSSSKDVCSAAPGKPLQECDMVVYDRSWDKHREVTSFNCSAAPSSKVQKRSLPGGLSDADPKDHTVQEMAQFAMQQLNIASNNIYKSKLVLVKKAQTQIVAGVNYHLTLEMVETNCSKGSSSKDVCSAAPGKPLQECDVVVYDRPWDKHREVTSFNCSAVPSSKHQKRSLPGGLSDADPKDHTVQEMAQFAMQQLNIASNNIYKSKLVLVKKAQTQIVAGVNYYLTLEMVETNCSKGSSSKDVCSAAPGKDSQVCDVVVYDRSWDKHREMTSFNCSAAPNSKVRERSIGQAEHVDPRSHEVLEAAKFSLRSIDRASNSIYKHALIRLVDAKVQTVSGKKYFLTVEIGESNCTKLHSDENCHLRAENSLNEKCKVVVWDRPWLKEKEVLDVQCGLRNKRSIVTRQKSQLELDLESFGIFKQKYNKSYTDEVENNKRFRIFRANLRKIKAFQENEQGTATYGTTIFADLSTSEFKQKYLGLKQGKPPKASSHHMVPAHIPDVQLPTDFDWRNYNAVTPVKNQGQCGSCWAFSVTGNVEGQVALKHGKLISLSEQELVDCDKSDSGCNGGYMTVAYESIEKLGGLELEDEYPYDAEEETCKFNKSDVQAIVTGSVNITSNETEMARWLVANGPISIGINANAMQFYMGGVSHPFKFLCNKNDLDHGVLLVGFGVHRTSIRHKILPYWLIKNSWGPHWGEKGYYRIYRGDGTCGVNQMASSAIVG